MEKEKYEPSQEEIEKAEEMAVEGEMTPEQEKMSEVRVDNLKEGERRGIEIKDREEKGKYEKISNIENLIGKWHENYSEAIEDGARKAAPKTIEKYELEIESVLKKISGRDNINGRKFIDDLSYALKHNTVDFPVACHGVPCKESLKTLGFQYKIEAWPSSKHTITPMRLTIT